MKKIILLVFFSLMIIGLSNNLFATAKNPVWVILNEPSIPDCPYGQRVYFEDRNSDGSYDYMNTICCDGTVFGQPICLVGGDHIGVGVGGRLKYGTLLSQDYIIEFYDQSDPDTVINYMIMNSTLGNPYLYDPENYPNQ